MYVGIDQSVTLAALTDSRLHASTLFSKTIPLPLYPLLGLKVVPPPPPPPGDTVMAGDQLCDIETDKAVVPLDSDYDAVLARILVGYVAEPV